MDIQQFRYDNHFQIFFESDEEVSKKKIPKLLIQPLLENAIFHGIEQKKEGGLIILTARLIRDTVVVTIEDNGVGMDPEIREKIERGETVPGKIHIGIGNVKERIQLNFGENYGVRIESAQGKGTKVILTFPVID
jgi:two-component system sensor histidine kinase YesM